jgi:DNA-binding MarR family transcriptional regulator
MKRRTPSGYLRPRCESNDFVTKDERLALRKCLLFMDALRAIRRTMPMQHAYAFLLVALEEGLGVQEYAERAGVTQAVMTRILFALSSRGRRREPGYGLVQQAVDLRDSRRHQTFLTVKGKALTHEIVRSVRPHRPSAKMLAEASQSVLSDHWLSRLIAAGRKLNADDIQLAVRQLELLVDHRQSKRSPRGRQHRV